MAEANGHNWRRADSEPAVRALIHAAWGSEVPDYLFFECPPGEPSPKDIATLTTIFFPGSKPNRGDIETHHSDSSPTGHALRIRGATTLVLSVTIRDRECRLFQFGHPGIAAMLPGVPVMPALGVDGETPRCVNLADRWGTHVNRAEAVAIVKESRKPGTTS